MYVVNNQKIPMKWKVRDAGWLRFILEYVWNIDNWGLLLGKRVRFGDCSWTEEIHHQEDLDY